MKRKKWTEADINALPSGEHQNFELKSGLLFKIRNDLLAKLAKTISALANSGGGNIFLGIDDKGQIDGVPSTEGRTPIREWLEQIIPSLVYYPISDFRVYVVEKALQSKIPSDREVIVIEIGDSMLAPHQCVKEGNGASKYTYYYREGGHSVPAPHFHLELLRQRLVSPVLKAKLTEVQPIQAGFVDNSLFLATRLHFLIENLGRIAAYKWALQIKEVSNASSTRINDYKIGRRNFPASVMPGAKGTTDITILPDSDYDHIEYFGLYLRPTKNTFESLKTEVTILLKSVSFTCRLVTETSIGELFSIELKDLIFEDKITNFILSQIGPTFLLGKNI